MDTVWTGLADAEHFNYERAMDNHPETTFIIVSVNLGYKRPLDM